MRPFHISLHAAPTVEYAEVPIQIEDRSAARLLIDAAQLTSPFPVTFGQALNFMASLPRMYVEPDGSWVWVGGENSVPWQLDGTLYDRGTHLQYVEMKGTCSAEAFDQFAAMLCPTSAKLLPKELPLARLVVQLMRYAVFLTGQEFRRFQFSDDVPGSKSKSR